MSSSLMLLGASLLLLCSCALGNDAFDGALYTFVVDAGSGGTRWSLFTKADGEMVVSTDTDDKVDWNKMLGEKAHDEVHGHKNALGGWPANEMQRFWTETLTVMEEKLPALLDKCGLDLAKANVKTELKKVAMHVRATAGMRENGLNKNKFEELETIATDDGYQLDALVIPGAVEGLFGFRSNVIFGNIPTTERDHYVYFEQGGASAQIVFRCPAKYCADDAPDAGGTRRLLAMKHTVAQAKKQAQLKKQGKKGYVETAEGCFFSESFMGYGKDELAAMVVLSNSANAKYCINEGITITKGNDGKYTAADDSGTNLADTAFIREMNDYSKVSGLSMDADSISGVAATDDNDNVEKCAQAIKDATLGVGDAAGLGEFRGFKADAATAENAVLVPFTKRWDRIIEHMGQCGGDNDYKKTDLFMNTPAWKTSQAADNFNSEKVMNWPLDKAAQQKWVFKASKEYEVFAPLAAATLLFIEPQLAEGAEANWNVHVSQLAQDWAPAGAQMIAQGKTFTYKHKAGAEGDSAAKFHFITGGGEGEGTGPAASPFEPEMWTITTQ